MRNMKEIKNAIAINQAAKLLEQSDVKIAKAKKEYNKNLAKLQQHLATPGLTTFSILINGMNDYLVEPQLQGNDATKALLAYNWDYRRQGHLLARRWPSWCKLHNIYYKFTIKSLELPKDSLDALTYFYNYICQKYPEDADEYILVNAFWNYLQYSDLSPYYIE